MVRAYNIILQFTYLLRPAFENWTRNQKYIFYLYNLFLNKASHTLSFLKCFGFSERNDLLKNTQHETFKLCDSGVGIHRLSFWKERGWNSNQAKESVALQMTEW